MDTREPSEIISEVCRLCDGGLHNEADTRFKIIDTILKDILAWPIEYISCEKDTNAGRADYILTNSMDRSILVVEAKKEGFYFELPANLNLNPVVIRIKRVISCPNIKAAMMQALSYALSQGCPYCAITNGKEWIFFSVFEQGKKWENLTCYIIPSIACFDTHYVKIYNNLSFGSVTQENSLEKLLKNNNVPPLVRYNPSNGISDFGFKIYNNRLAAILRPILKAFFSDLSAEHYEFMEKCYVEPKRYNSMYKGFSDIIHDRVSPFFANSGVKDFSVDGNGGYFGDEVRRKVVKRSAGDVLILFGGKGAGKSTFLNKFFFPFSSVFFKE